MGARRRQSSGSAVAGSHIALSTREPCMPSPVTQTSNWPAMTSAATIAASTPIAGSRGSRPRNMPLTVTRQPRPRLPLAVESWPARITLHGEADSPRGRTTGPGDGLSVGGVMDSRSKELVVSPPISRRIAPLSGLAFFLLVMVGNSIATGDSNVGRDDSAEKILANIRAHDGAAWWCGTALEIAGLLLLGVFTVYTVRRIRSAGVDGRLPAIALAGGLGTVALKLVSGGPAVYPVVRSNEISADTAKTFVTVNDWMFVASWVGIGAFVAAGGVAAARAGLLPRPLGIAGAVFAGLI